MSLNREGCWALIVHGGAEGDGGGIGRARDGRLGWAHNSPHFAVALVASEMQEARAYLKKDEERGG